MKWHTLSNGRCEMLDLNVCAHIFEALDNATWHSQVAIILWLHILASPCSNTCTYQSKR